MLLKHPLTGGTYESRDDGQVIVKEHGKEGVFTGQGEWVSGELRVADPHMINWVGGPIMSNRRTEGLATSRSGAGSQNVNKNVPPDLRSRPGKKGSRGMELGLQGKKAIITAASKGIGLAIAQTLADEGVDVAICARSEGGLESARKDLEGRGVKVFTQATDVGDGDALRAFIAAATDALG
jgi:hypothetical protein